MAKDRRSKARELMRHSTFIEDGSRLFNALVGIAGQGKAKHGSFTRRGSRARAIIIHQVAGQMAGHFRITLKSNNGHQQFRVFAAGLTREALQSELARKFPAYHVRASEAAS